MRRTLALVSASIVPERRPVTLLWTLAFDHRNSFRTAFLGLRRPATPDDEATCRRLKAIVAGGLLRAIADGLPAGRPAALVDAEYGTDAIARLRHHGVPFAVPVEASGHRELAFIDGDEGFGPALLATGATWAKVLVRYNPEADAELNRRQRNRMLMLQRWAADHEPDVMIELLVPPEPHQLEQGEARYDDELRPGLTGRAVAELRDAGLAPALWKLEGMPSSEACAAIAAAAGADVAGGPGCLVLGRGADSEAVRRWLALAAPVAGFTGFAVGRTLWWDALRAHLEGDASAVDTEAAIAAAYRALIDAYLLAAQ